MKAINYETSANVWKRDYPAKGGDNFFLIEKAVFVKATLNGVTVRRNTGVTHDFLHGLCTNKGLEEPQQVFSKFVALAGVPEKPVNWFTVTGDWTPEASTPENIALLSKPGATVLTTAKISIVSPVKTPPSAASAMADASANAVSPTPQVAEHKFDSVNEDRINASVTAWLNNKAKFETGNNLLNVLTNRSNEIKNKSSMQKFTAQVKIGDKTYIVNLGYDSTTLKKAENDPTKKYPSEEQLHKNIAEIFRRLDSNKSPQMTMGLASSNIASPKSITPSPTSNRVIVGTVGNKTIYGNMANETKESTTPAPQEGMKRVYIDPVVPVFNPIKREQPLKPLPFAPHRQIITSFTLVPPS